MYLKRSNGPRQVLLPGGTVLSQADLPPADTRRWVASRKAIVVQAVSHGLLTREEAIERYALSDEEFSLWEEAITNHGAAALKVTMLRKYRAT